MRYFILAALFFTLYGMAIGQTFYYTSFPDSLVFPSGWLPSDTRIALSNQVSSSGYSPPPASGATNVRFDDCLPQSQTVRLTVSGVISTMGKTGIRVGFGRRRSTAWTNSLALEWSSNGTAWNLVSSDISSGATTSWSSIFYDLPSDVEDVPNLRFRFSFVTQNAQNCTTPPNFRIDDFAVGSNFSLPVELAHFEARPASFQTHLTWSTASETTNAYFAVERSTDGRNFIEIGRVQGAGTVRETRQYNFWDARPAVGTNYYRLRQVDLDDNFAYSLVRAVEFRGNTLVRIFPSPVQDVLNLEWASNGDEQEGIWEVWDMAGRLLAKGNNSSTFTIPVHDWHPGTYMLRIATARQNAVQTFLKH